MLSQLAGMPVMTRETGRNLGNVKDIIFNPQSGMLVALALESSGFFSPHRWFLPTGEISSIGEDAIMVATGRALKKQEYARDLADTVERGVVLTGKTVVTEDGNILGNVVDVTIDPDTGKALRYIISGGAFSDVQTGRRAFPVPDALVVGADALVVPNSVERKMEAQEPGGLAGAYAGTKAGAESFWTRVQDWWSGVTRSAMDKETDFALGKTAGADVTDDMGNLIVGAGEEITEREVVRARVADKVHQLALAAGWGVTRGGYESAREKVAGAAEEQEARFVLGKKADKAVLDDQGNVIVAKGEEIDQADVDQAREAGKLGELTSSVTAAGAKGAFGAARRKTGEAYESAREYVSGTREQVSRGRLSAQQRDMALGKVSAVDIRDDRGNTLIAEGEVFTPMIIEQLESEGRLDQIRLMPVMRPDRTPGEMQVPRIELLVRTEDVRHE